jgi:hypothetical protein
MRGKVRRTRRSSALLYCSLLCGIGGYGVFYNSLWDRLTTAVEKKCWVIPPSKRGLRRSSYARPLSTLLVFPQTCFYRVCSSVYLCVRVFESSCVWEFVCLRVRVCDKSYITSFYSVLQDMNMTLLAYLWLAN